MTLRFWSSDYLVDSSEEEFATASRIAAIEAERKLVKIVTQVFVVHCALVSTRQPPLEQRYHEVDPGQELGGSLLVAAKEGDLMYITSRFQPVIPEPSVGVDKAAGFDHVLYKRSQDICRGVWNPPDTDSTDSASLFIRRSYPSSDGAAEWLDLAIDRVAPVFKKVWLRGDTDFSLTHNFDRWDERVGFVFGYDAKGNLVEMADALPESCWKPLDRPLRYEVQTEERQRPENVKEQVVKEREFKNIRLRSEQVAEFDYRPTHCSKTYRMVVVRKNLTIEKGESRLFDDVRYFFYITNDGKMTPQEIVLFANDRCNQENVIGQLKSGVNALRMPSDGLVSNWAYMVIAALAWSLKAWYGLVTLAPSARRDILRMGFKRFLVSFIQIPCQILATGRRLVYRILTYSRHLETFLATFDHIRQLKFT